MRMTKQQSVHDQALAAAQRKFPAETWRRKTLACRRLAAGRTSIMKWTNEKEEEKCPSATHQNLA